MIPNIYQTPQGIRLQSVRTDRFKAGSLSLLLPQPIRQDTAYLNSLLISVLLRGSEKYPSVAALNRRLDYLFGTVLSVRNYFRGDLQCVGLTADLIDPAYLPDGTDLARDVAEVMAEVLFHPLLDENGLLLSKYVESEKIIQRDAIRSLRNTPSAYARHQCRILLFENSPRGAEIYGTEEQVMAVTPELLTAHWKKFVSSLSPEFFYVGNLPGTRILPILGEAFGKGLPEIPQKRCRITPDRLPGESAEKRAEESLPVSQGWLVLGLRTGTALGDKEYFACNLMNEILGASPVSKLFMNVRERLSLCYSCSSVYYATDSVMFISCGLECGNRERAEAEIFAQLEELRAGNITDEELDAAKKSLDSAFAQVGDSPKMIEAYFLPRDLMGISQSPERAREQIAAITREEIAEAARRVRVDTVFFLNATGQEDAADDGEEDAL